MTSGDAPTIRHGQAAVDARTRPTSERRPPGPAASEQTGDRRDPPPRKHLVATAAAAFVVYGLLALVAHWPAWPGDPSRVPGCPCGDMVEQLWYLNWTPFALLHGYNPLLTNFLDFPRTVNLGDNTFMPLLGILGAPLTLGFGAVSALTFWYWLALPLSATACFVLLRRWVQWQPAAFVGGLLYGFSPYMVGQDVGHLFLIFVPFPPLVLLLLDELVVRQRRHPIAVGAWLGVVAAAAYLVAPEVAASTAVMTVVGLALVALARPRSVVLHARHAVIGLAVAACLCGVLIAYPAWIEVAGPDRFVGSVHGTYPFQADLLALIVPSVHQLLAPTSLVTVSNHFIFGDTTENGSYLGIPLLLLLVFIVVRLWRLPLVRWAAAMALAAEVLALGPYLTVDGHDTGVPLPDALLDHLPQFANFVFARFSLYVDLSVAVLVAIGVDQLVRHRPPVRLRHRRRGRMAGRVTPVLFGTAVAVALVPLLPAWPYGSSPPGAPAFFTSAALDRVPPGSVALTYPYTQDPTDQAMLWQVAAHMRFKLMGGYVIIPGPPGTTSYDPFPPTLQSVPATLMADAGGTTPAAELPGATTATPADVRRFVATYHVDTVLFDPIGAAPGKALALLEAALGPPRRGGGVDAWFHLQHHP